MAWSQFKPVLTEAVIEHLSPIQKVCDLYVCNHLCLCTICTIVLGLYYIIKEPIMPFLRIGIMHSFLNYLHCPFIPLTPPYTHLLQSQRYKEVMEDEAYLNGVLLDGQVIVHGMQCIVYSV